MVAIIFGKATITYKMPKDMLSIATLARRLFGEDRV
jgi:hypothetical protein